jgi:hypothetical protein
MGCIFICCEEHLNYLVSRCQNPVEFICGSRSGTNIIIVLFTAPTSIIYVLVTGSACVFLGGWCTHGINVYRGFVALQQFNASGDLYREP